MPEDYYYHRGKRVPVHRREGLIAVRFRANVQEQGIQGFTQAYNKDLKPHIGLQEIQRTHFRIYEIIREEHTDSGNLLQKIRQHADIHEAGEVYIQDNRIRIQTAELVVKFKPELRSAQIDEIKKEYGLETAETLGFSGGAQVLRVTKKDKSALEIANLLVEKKLALYAYPNWIELIDHRQTYCPNDPLIQNGCQWHHKTIDTPSAWQVTMGEGIKLAVVDHGVDTDHEDLQGKICDPIDLTGNPPTGNVINKNESHGTEVAGMAVAAADNGVAGAGSAPKAQLMPIKVDEITTQTHLAKAFQYAADRGSQVITCSLGDTTWQMSEHFQEAIDYATTYGREGRGCVYTQAVCNGGYKICNDEVSSYERSIAVNLTDKMDRHQASGYGPELDLCAPGFLVWTITNCDRNNLNQVVDSQKTIQQQGTSYATPLTAGVACLVLSKNGTFSWEEVRQVLLDSAEKIDNNFTKFPYQCAPASRPPGTRNDIHGYGRLNAKGAVTLAGNDSPRDLYIRDTKKDTGAELQPAWGFWDSPDIWIRNQADGSEGHQQPIPGQDNYVYARVANRGSEDSLPTWVRFYMTTFAGAEFRYPYDYRPDTSSHPGGLPGNCKDPSEFEAPGTYWIGQVRIDSVKPGQPQIVEMKWEMDFLPSSLSSSPDWYPCLLVEVSPHDGPLPAESYRWGRPFAWGNNNLAQKSLIIISAQSGDVINFPFRFGHPENKDPLSLDVVIPGSAKDVASRGVPDVGDPADFTKIKVQPVNPDDWTSVELSALDGNTIFNLGPGLKLTTGPMTGPITNAGWKEAFLKLRVPGNAATGQSFVIDLAQRNGSGQLTGGLRLQVNIL